MEWLKFKLDEQSGPAGWLVRLGRLAHQRCLETELLVSVYRVLLRSSWVTTYPYSTCMCPHRHGECNIAPSTWTRQGFLGGRYDHDSRLSLTTLFHFYQLPLVTPHTATQEQIGNNMRYTCTCIGMNEINIMHRMHHISTPRDFTQRCYCVWVPHIKLFGYKYKNNLKGSI